VVLDHLTLGTRGRERPKHWALLTLLWVVERA